MEELREDYISKISDCFKQFWLPKRLLEMLPVEPTCPTPDRHLNTVLGTVRKQVTNGNKTAVKDVRGFYVYH
jgi:hypothetical protein